MGIRGLVAIVLLASCGAPPAREPAPATTPVAAVPAPAPEAPRAPSLPLELAPGAPLPEPGTPERALLDRWAALTRHTLGDTDVLRAERAPSALLGAATLRVAQEPSQPGRDPDPIVFLERDGQPGPVVLVALANRSPIPGVPVFGDRATRWLAAMAACDDAQLAELASGALLGGPAPSELCEDLEPAIATALLARADREGADRAVRALLADVMAIAAPAATPTIVERAADVEGERTAGARFVPFTAARDPDGVRASGTLRMHETCAPSAETMTFTLRATASTIELGSAPLAVLHISARCI